MTGSAEGRRIRSLRPPKPLVDPWRPVDVQVEDERLPGGDRVTSVTVFLAGRECPFTCVFCDLWRYTLDGPTPSGAIPAQLAEALAGVASKIPTRAHIKLYNASNFFDDKAVPVADDERILRLLEPFEQVVVECHARLLGPRAWDFAEGLRGRLQVALGLETVHPEALPRLNKKATLEDFDRAAAALAKRGLGIRAFVLVGCPFVPPEESLEWIERSVLYAFARGADHVSLIPVRLGNGEMERLQRQGLFHPPSLHQIEAAFEHCLGLGETDLGETGLGETGPGETGPGETGPGETGPGETVVTVDVWDLERFAGCSTCRGQREARLARINLSGVPELAVSCDVCEP